MREVTISTYAPESGVLLSQRVEMVQPVQLPEFPDLSSQLKSDGMWDLRDQFDQF